LIEGLVQFACALLFVGGTFYATLAIAVIYDCQNGGTPACKLILAHIPDKMQAVLTR
jgi:hypothetical protein